MQFFQNFWRTDVILGRWRDKQLLSTCRHFVLILIFMSPTAMWGGWYSRGNQRLEQLNHSLSIILPVCQHNTAWHIVGTQMRSFEHWMSLSGKQFLACAKNLKNVRSFFVSCVYQFIIKDTNKHPDEEVHGVRTRRVPSTGASPVCPLNQQFNL